MSRAMISPKTRYQIFKRDKFMCRYCGAKAPEVALEIDHIIPVSRGGDNDFSNLITACQQCNRGKSNDLPYSEAPIPPIYIEKKTQRVQLILQPSLYKRMQKAAKQQKVSFNELVHQVFEKYLSEREKNT
mgnify:CR=1 FL=1